MELVSCAVHIGCGKENTFIRIVNLRLREAVPSGLVGAAGDKNSATRQERGSIFIARCDHVAGPSKSSRGWIIEFCVRKYCRRERISTATSEKHFSVFQQRSGIGCWIIQLAGKRKCSD